MKQGVVSWFSRARGYGFITPADGGPDIFCHFSGIAAEGWRALQKDQKVIFDTIEERKGLVAINVRVVS